METLTAILPIIIDILVAGLLVALIVLVIKVIGIINDAQVLLNNIQDKVNTLNGLFSIIEKIDMGINGVAKRIVKVAEAAVSKFTGKRSEEDDIIDEEDELEDLMKGRE